VCERKRQREGAIECLTGVCICICYSHISASWRPALQDRGRESAHGRERERESVCMYMRVCACTLARENGELVCRHFSLTFQPHAHHMAHPSVSQERESERVRARERESVCTCVCGRALARESSDLLCRDFSLTAIGITRARERECAWGRGCVCVYTCVCTRS